MKSGKWMQPESQREKHAGTKGSFTRQAHRAGFESATAYAHHLQAHPGSVSTTTKRRANMALRFAGASK